MTPLEIAQRVISRPLSDPGSAAVLAMARALAEIDAVTATSVDLSWWRKLVRVREVLRAPSIALADQFDGGVTGQQ